MSCSSELTRSSLVNDQCLLARCGIDAVGHTNMCPTVKLTDDLVVTDAAGDDLAHHFVRSYTGHTNVSSAPDAVLDGTTIALCACASTVSATPATTPPAPASHFVTLFIVLFTAFIPADLFYYGEITL